MKKKFLISTALFIAFLAFSASYSFASSNMVNTIENGAQNIASDVGDIVSRGVDATRNTLEGAGNMISNGVSDVVSGTENGTNKVTMGTTNYNATRTSTGDATFAGMNATAWTWLIVGILGAAIIALVWFYGKQHEDATSTNNNE